jgi:hypothetical protein
MHQMKYAAFRPERRISGMLFRATLLASTYFAKTVYQRGAIDDLKRTAHLGLRPTEPSLGESVDR